MADLPQASALPLQAATQTPAQERTREPPPRKHSRPLRLLGYSLLSYALTFGLALATQGTPKLLLGLGFGLATLFALAGLGYTLGALVSWRPGVVKPWGWLLLLVSHGFMVAFGALTTLLSVVEFRRGRQLRRRGRVLLPPMVTGDSWAAEQPLLPIPEPLRASLAQQWRENGRTEHASVAAFTRLTTDLLALGAPPTLLADAQRDALDEIRHAQLCFSLARAIDGCAVSPAPFAALRSVGPGLERRDLALARLAVDSLVDGALHEGVSARVLAQLAKRTQVPAIRALLKELAADEGRHAAHGWDVVEWCVQEGGQPVLDALQGALHALPTQLTSPRPEQAARGEWEPYGIHGQALEAAEYEKARAAIVRRVSGLGLPVAC